MSVACSLAHNHKTSLQLLTFVAVQIKDAVGNEYGKPKDVAGENRYAFTSHADSAFDVCFENILTASSYNLYYARNLS